MTLACVSIVVRMQLTKEAKTKDSKTRFFILGHRKGSSGSSDGCGMSTVLPSSASLISSESDIFSTCKSPATLS